MNIDIVSEPEAKEFEKKRSNEVLQMNPVTWICYNI